MPSNPQNLLKGKGNHQLWPPVIQLVFSYFILLRFSSIWSILCCVIHFTQVRFLRVQVGCPTHTHLSYTRICQGWGAEAGTSSGTSADGRLVQTFVSGLVGRGSGLTQDEVHISCFIRFIRVMLCHSHSQTLFLSFHSLLESLRNAVAKRTVYKRATQLSPSSTGSKAGDTSSYRISGAFLSCWRYISCRKLRLLRKKHVVTPVGGLDMSRTSTFVNAYSRFRVSATGVGLAKWTKFDICSKAQNP